MQCVRRKVAVVSSKLKTHESPLLKQERPDVCRSQAPALRIFFERMTCGRGDRCLQVEIAGCGIQRSGKVGSSSFPTIFLKKCLVSVAGRSHLRANTGHLALGEELAGAVLACVNG